MNVNIFILGWNGGTVVITHSQNVLGLNLKASQPFFDNFMKLSVNGCLSFKCQSCDMLATCPGRTRLSPNVNWDWLQLP